jgi:hypothetical protein
LGEGGALRLGLLLDALGLVMVAGVHSFVVLAPAVVALTIGQGLVMPTLASIVAGRVPAGRRGGARLACSRPPADWPASWDPRSEEHFLPSLVRRPPICSARALLCWRWGCSHSVCSRSVRAARSFQPGSMYVTIQ